MLLAPLAILVGYSVVLWPGPAAVSAMVLSLVCLWTIYRAVRAAFIVTPSGITARAAFRDRSASWGDVIGFKAIPSSALNKNVYMAVMIKHGRPLITSAVSARSEQADFALRTFEQLEALRARWGTRASTEAAR